MTTSEDSFNNESVEQPIIEATPVVEEQVVQEPVVMAEEPVVAVETAPEPVVEPTPEPVVVPEPTPAPVSLGSDRVVYSIKEKNLPGFGLIKKGYSKIDGNKAASLVQRYSFIRFASDEEIKNYKF
jgi:hypothetical protein